jgi:predicted dehydrogenase
MIWQLLTPVFAVKIRSLIAHTAQLQEHLSPIDTADASLRLDNGATGVVSISFGTTFQGNDLSVACERGTVSVSFDTVTVRPAKEAGATQAPEPIVVEKPNPDGRSGVAAEVFAWAKSLKEGRPDPLQSPEEALADLELIEAMVKSGEQGGAPVELALQI